MGGIVTWNQQQAIGIISGKVLSGMDKACQFVQGKAKAAAPKRTGRGASHIEYSVKVWGNTVEGKVGFEPRSSGFYLWILEVGASNRHTKKGAYRGSVAARPFLRPAVFNNGAQIVRLIAGG